MRADLSFGQGIVNLLYRSRFKTSDRSIIRHKPRGERENKPECGKLKAETRAEAEGRGEGNAKRKTERTEENVSVVQMFVRPTLT